MFANFQSFLDKPVDLDYVFNPPSKLESFDAEEAAPSGSLIIEGHGASSSSRPQNSLHLPTGSSRN